MELSDRSCSDELCIMNEAVLMIAVHLQTEKSPVAELQATQTSRGGTDAGGEQCHVNITRGKKNSLPCSQCNSTMLELKCAEGGGQLQFRFYIKTTAYEIRK